MTLLFTGRKADLTPALRDLVEKKLLKLERILGESPHVHVILASEKHRRLVEIVARARVGTLAAHADEATFEDALSAGAQRLVTQAKKHHEKMSRGRTRRAMLASRRAPSALAALALDGTPPAAASRVVPMGPDRAAPMSVEQAVRELEAGRDPFLIFRNAESRQVSVLVRRDDGRIGLIEPEV
jgi:putative sigma-54 modulation protein